VSGQEEEERLAELREKTARLKALREERDRRFGLLVKKKAGGKAAQKTEQSKPLSAWLEDQEKSGRRR
jgi:hypothetical protein